MIKARLLVPLTDNTGAAFSEAHLWRLAEQIVETFGGFTSDRELDGAWSSPDGRLHLERVREYEVALDSWFQVAAFLDLARWARAHFEQEAIYLEINGVPEIIS